VDGAAETPSQLRSLLVCHPIRSFSVPTVHGFSLPIPALPQLAALRACGGQGVACLWTFALLF